MVRRTVWLAAIVFAAGAKAAGETAWPPLVDIQGQEHQPLQEKDLRAVVLITVIADCPIVNSYAPEYNRLRADYQDQGVRVFLLQVDPHATLASLQQHAQSYDLKLPVIHDADHAWVTRLGATRTPEATVLAPDGTVRYRGRIDDRYVDFGRRRAAATTRDLRNAVEAILDGRPVANPRSPAVGCYIPRLPNRGETP
jgi:peroxiredoxin